VEKIFLNEVNTISRIHLRSACIPDVEASGIPFRQLIDKLIDLALEQHAEKARTKIIRLNCRKERAERLEG